MFEMIIALLNLYVMQKGLSHRGLSTIQVPGPDPKKILSATIIKVENFGTVNRST